MTKLIPIHTAAIFWLCSMFTWLGAMTSQAAELNLRLNPDLQIVSRPIPGGDQLALVAVIPLPNTGTGGHVVEFDFEVTRAWYYAPLKVGVQSADHRDAIILTFEKSEGYDSQCTLSIRQNGRERNIAVWKHVELAKYRLALQWQGDGKVRFLARKGNTEVFEVSGDEASFDHNLPQELSDFFLWVVNGGDNGYIGYDCDDESIQMRSQPGGGDYVITAAIDYLSVKPASSGDDK